MDIYYFYFLRHLIKSTGCDTLKQKFSLYIRKFFYWCHSSKKGRKEGRKEGRQAGREEKRNEGGKEG